MLRGLGSWLGLERAGEEKLLPAEKRSSSAEEEEEEVEEEEKVVVVDKEAAVQNSEQPDSEALLSQAKGLGSEVPTLTEVFKYFRRKFALNGNKKHFVFPTGSRTGQNYFAEQYQNTDGEQVLQHLLHLKQLHMRVYRDAKNKQGYLFNFATAATKKISESVAETAQTIKKSVEEGKIDSIIDKTIIGDFQKEQKKFVQEQQTKKSEAAVPPWVDSNEEETIQQQILALSADKRNFLRDPPAGVQFNFDFDQMYPVAMVMLQEDELLNRMRFDLVPKHVKEEVFWRNYFYRVSLIKQSAQLTALAAQQQAAGKEENKGREEDSPLKETVRPKTPPVAIKPQIKSQEDDEEISTSPGVSEFVSDAFDACNLNQEDLKKEMEQLVLDKKKEETSVVEEETADWEKELQQELQEYEVVTESEKRDENWDKEIEEMLQEEN